MIPMIIEQFTGMLQVLFILIREDIMVVDQDFAILLYI